MPSQTAAFAPPPLAASPTGPAALPPALQAAFNSAPGRMLSVEGYMQHCLYHPTEGYYTTHQPLSSPAEAAQNPPSQNEGDFTTAPELSPLFGQCVAEWLASTWHSLGAPPLFHVVEVGGGRGALMHALLGHLHRAHPACAHAAHVHMVEISPTLATLQHNKLAPFAAVSHHTALPPLAAQNPDVPVILIANEVLDAFPIQQFISYNGHWHQRTVHQQAPGAPLHFGLQPMPEQTTLPPHIPPASSLPPHTVYEYPAQQLAWLASVQRTLAPAAALMCDYGANASPTHTQDTLQALMQHTPVSPLSSPTRADLTTQVNFSHAIAALGGGAHCTLGHMAPFLLQHRFASLAVGALEAAQTVEEKLGIEATSHRLLHPNRMGALFCTLQYRKKPLK